MLCPKFLTIKLEFFNIPIEEMIILKVFLGIIFLLVIPELLGLLFTKFMTEKNNVLFSLIIGYIVEISIFEFIYFPMYYLEFSFKTLFYTWIILMIFLSVLSIIFTYKSFKEVFENLKRSIIETPKVLAIIFVILVGVQVYYPVRYMQIIDPDDAFYLSTVNITIETNSLFQYNAYDGSEYTQRPLRYCLSGLCAYYAALSEILQTHPAIFTHTIWPAIIIPIEYIIYIFIAKKLFNNDIEKVAYFMIILAIIHIFGYVSVYMDFSFFAYRSWQGKALIGNFIIPLIWLTCFYCIDERKKFVNWLLLFLVMVAGCFVTEMGVFLTPNVVVIFAIIHFAKNKNFLDVFKYMVCCLPEFIVGLIYILGV